MIDPARDETLLSGELQIDREAFDRIDSNFDGSIYADELERAVTDAADLELIVRLGRREPGQATIERLEGSAGSPPFGAPGFRRVGDLILIDLPTTTIELRTEEDGSNPFEATRAAPHGKIPPSPTSIKQRDTSTGMRSAGSLP